MLGLRSALLVRSTSSKLALHRLPAARSRCQFSSSSAPFSTGPTASTLYPKGPPKVTHKLRNTAVVLGLGGAVFAYDRVYNAEAIGRTLRTATYGVLMAIDFKLNFNPENSDAIDALHERVAWRIHHICVTNGGLYIKLAQSIAIQATILPKPYRDAFATIYDGAPSVDFDAVVKVFKGEFGIHPDEAFDEFTREAVASASIAQVHKARLKLEPGQAPWKEGEGFVAVKIRKPSVPKQITYDLFAYRYMLLAFQYLFDLPVAFVADYVCEQMKKEIDLAHEAQNAETTRGYLMKEDRLKNKVMIPPVYWKYTGASVMTAEYITACKLTDAEGLAKYKVNPKEVMDNVIALFSAMTFKWGFVHLDPHPGNVLVRPHPTDPSRPQIVLIDHGLSIPLSEKFRSEYALLWRSLFVADLPSIEKVAQSWGIAAENSDMLASATLLRPHSVRNKAANIDESGKKIVKSTYEQQTGLKERLRSMLQNEELIPRELILLARSMRMIQANNSTLGSVSNRINIMAKWAVEGYMLSNAPLSFSAKSTSLLNFPLRSYLVQKSQNLIFTVALFAIDVTFALNQFRSWVLAGLLRGGKKGEGFEDVLQRQVSNMAREEFGVEIGEEAFNG